MTHGGNIYEISKKIGVEHCCLLDFSANINPLGVPDNLRQIMVEAIDDLINYPDINYSDLKNAIGEKYKLSCNDVHVGNGGAQVIFDFIRALNPNKSLIVYPTFAEYERALRAVDSEIKEFYLREDGDFELDIEALIKEIDETLDMVILCNPNNPTGTLISRSDLIRILEKCRENRIFFMVDEAFMDFSDEGDQKTLLREVEGYDNLMVTRSFTKFYGIPGLRLGFGACSHGTIRERLKLLAIPWSVNTFASYFGKVLLEDKDYENKTHRWLRDETPRFMKELKELNLFKVYKPSANYILMKILAPDLTGEDLRNRLIKKNILVRDCSNFKGLDKGFVRIAIKAPGDNQELLGALKRL